MWPIFINIITLSVACILVFILRILPAKMKTRNAYLILLILELIMHLIFELFYLLKIINVYIFAIGALSMVVLYGPTLYYYTRKFYSLSTNHFFKQIILLEIGLWCILYSSYSTQWMLSSYYAVILLIYFISVLRLKPALPLKREQSWMKTTGIGFGVLVLLHITEVLWINLDIESAIPVVRLCTAIQNLFSLLFLLIVIRQIITNPSIFSKAKIRIPYETISSSQNTSELEILYSYVIENKSYKNNELTRKMVSDKTGLSIHQISEVINSEIKKNFSDWINDSRIDEAKVMLKETGLPIKEIYFEVGFNSKSAFNSAFKKRTKKTPSQYRKEFDNQ